MVVSSSPHSFCSCWYYEWHLEDRPWPRCDPRLVLLGPTVPWHGNPCANVAGCGRSAQGRPRPAPRRGRQMWCLGYANFKMISTPYIVHMLWRINFWKFKKKSRNNKLPGAYSLNLNLHDVFVQVLLCLVQYLIPAVPFLFAPFQLHLFPMPMRP